MITNREYESRFTKFNIMVHLIKEFMPAQQHKLTYEDDKGIDVSVMFHSPSSLDELEEQIKQYFYDNNITASAEADLIINYI